MFVLYGKITVVHVFLAKRQFNQYDGNKSVLDYHFKCCLFKPQLT